LSVSRGLSRFALVGVAVAALLLTGCGRKGPLEAPPSSQELAAPASAQQPPSGQPSLGEPEHSTLAGERPVEEPSPISRRKSFFLDWLLK
jgi:predicted small lipoprotein YifL